MRTLRHPGVIRVYDTVETDAYIYVATERVVPLTWPVRRKNLSEETLKWGLYTIANTLAFVNDEASSVHGNIRLSSIFTSESGEWRIGGLEILSSMKEDDAIIYKHGSSIPSCHMYTPPEIAKAGWEAMKRNPLPAPDAYGYGILIFEVFNGNTISNDQIGVTKSLPPSMHQNYKRLLTANPKVRLSVSHFKDQGRRSGGFFETPLVKLSEGVDNLGLKSDGEREEFLAELDEVADDFPEEFFSVKVLPELLKSVEFGGGGPKVFASVMMIGKKLSSDEWNNKLTPVVVRLFTSPDRAIRVCLLDNLPNMIEHLPQKIVNDKIFPQLVTGFTDVAPVVREQTVKAVLTIISKLVDRTINGELLKHLAKTANDEQPGIRTNTTICMGKIARSLGPNTRQKVLLAAFSRSLRDPFIHARNAALLALAATADLFGEEDCATRILPALCPSLIDKEKLVRDQANKAFDIYLQRIKKHASGLPDSVLPSPNVINANGITSRVDGPQTDSSVWAGWTISSFTNKLGSATGAMQSKALPQAPPTERSSSVPPTGIKPQNLPNSVSTSTIHGQVLTEKTTAALASNTAKKLLQDPEADQEEVDEAWGELAEDSFFDATSDALAQPEVASSELVAFDDGCEPDFEGWLNAQAQAKLKPKGPLPKGMSKPLPANLARPTVIKSTTTGSIGSGVGTKKLSTTTLRKPVSTKEVVAKPAEVDDDWGDAWD
ncbi:uncharacterized protein KY384_006953 [Bacidia gigantensis]|uniref:uncharacterized protein n=1 Tax=Bacidia gigantensis TaxID=2732470 RepID=UPI001D04E030|nr:uncharacterized protein KY384_006953 [Bacidia gigantensis]KAG8528037.1 hypothetical protein KY384_006953 [Bacidia gigantensis]